MTRFAEQDTSVQPSPANWYRTAYRRHVVDMHVPDWDPRFLSALDPQVYVEQLIRAHIQATVLYAHSHVGLFNYPTTVGRMHQGLGGRDFFGEVLELCHHHDIRVVAYCSLVFDRWAYDRHAHWRMILVDGKEARNHIQFGLIKNGRHGLCCPNAPGYRAYVEAFTREIVGNYDVDGIRFDMTFWPAVCYCAACQARFQSETGGELPRVINWRDPHWLLFQQKREAWLVDFAAHATGIVRAINPQVSVEHQSSTYLLDWQLGVTDALARQSDFLQGDFYGDALQGSVVRKLLHNLTENPPYGFETSVAESLESHTGIKSYALMSAKAYGAVAGDGAMIFIDAIDPAGTLNPAVYERIGSVFAETLQYDSCRGGTLCQDVGVYLSTISKFDPADNGKHPNDPTLSTRSPHVDAVVSASRALIADHIPFGIITRKDLHRLDRHSVLLLPNVLLMDTVEVEAFRAFVQAGGCLYASKYTSLVNRDGIVQPDFMLADVFGVSYAGETASNITYIAPSPRAPDWLGGFSAAYPLGLAASQVTIRAAASAEVLGELVLPYSHPQDTDRFSSIHSNPPGIYTGQPAVVHHVFGLGQAIYAAGDVESVSTPGVLTQLVRLFKQQFSYEAVAPACVEITLFDHPETGRLRINLLNFQKTLPNLPVEGVQVRIRLDGRHPQRLAVLPEGDVVPCQLDGDWLGFTAPRLDTFLMLGLDYRRG